MFIRILIVSFFFFTCHLAHADSIFLPPAHLQLYDKDPQTLTKRELWTVRIFGLRSAPLHPGVWALRKTDRTDSRHMVPMRPFYLRASEAPDFRVKQISFEFQFRPVKPAAFEKGYHQNDPVLDLGFGGVVDESVDEGELLRLSAFPGLESGFYSRAGTKLTKVAPLSLSQLETGKRYVVGVAFTKSGVAVELNGAAAGTLASAGVDKGLISFTTGWNPVRISSLEILGSEKAREQSSYSGLVALLEKDSPKKAA